MLDFCTLIYYNSSERIRACPYCLCATAQRQYKDLIAKENEYCRFQQFFKTVKNAEPP